jgi:thiol-disulfide isomerase/thioredoxin
LANVTRTAASRTALIRNSILAAAILAIAAAIVVWSVKPRTAPELGFMTVRGEPVSFPQLHGQVVLVNFWATDCAVCLREMPSMAALYRKYRAQGFDAVFVAMPYDRPDYVLSYARRLDLPFKVALDLNGMLNAGFGGVKLTPTTFVLDKRGSIVERIVGEPDFARLDSLIERMLGESA